MVERGLTLKMSAIATSINGNKNTILIALAITIIFSGAAVATTMATVCFSGCDYTSIQKAIDGTSSGDTILVYSGTYYENVTINKQLILMGVDTGGGKPVVDANKNGSVITLSANGITLEGFETKNQKRDWSSTEAGIKVISSNNIIRGNKVSNNYCMYCGYSNYQYGIYGFASRNNTIISNDISNHTYGIIVGSILSTISNNTVYNNDFGMMASSLNIILNNNISNNGWGLQLSSGSTLRSNILSNNLYNFKGGSFNDIDTSNLLDGKPIYYLIGARNTVIDSSSNAGVVYCFDCENITVKGLNLTNVDTGVYFQNTRNSRIQDNYIPHVWQGAWLISSINNTITNNTIHKSLDGIRIESSYTNTITGNNVIDNSGSGISFYDSRNNTIMANTLSNNMDGLILGSSHNNSFFNNTINRSIADNLRIVYSNDNKFYLNNFLPLLWYYDRILYSYFSTNTWSSPDKLNYSYKNKSYTNHLGNYWSEYSGSDANNDGIGDTSYNITNKWVGGGAGAQDNYPLMQQSGNYFSQPNPQPSCAIELRKDGNRIDTVNAGEFFDIYVGGSTNDTGIKEVRFSSDESQDGTPTGSWTQEYNWSNSLGDWDAYGKTKKWSFATSGLKEVWVEVKDGSNETAKCSANISTFEDFTFAHITDIHLGYYSAIDKILPCVSSLGMRESVVRFTDTLEDIKRKNPDFLVATGDLVEYDTPEFFMAFKNLVTGIKVYTTPGNHDRRGGIPQLFTGDNLTDYKDIVNPLNPAEPGEVDWNFNHKGYNFIGLDSGADYGVSKSSLSPHSCSATPEGNGLNETSWNKLKSGGFSNGNQRQIIFMHHPLINDNNDTEFGDNVSPESDEGWYGNNEAIAHHRADLINYTLNNKVDLVLSGHSHKSKIVNISGALTGIVGKNSENPLFIQTQSATKDDEDGYRHGYRIIEIKDGKAKPKEAVFTPQFDRTENVSTSLLNINRKTGTITMSGLEISAPIHCFSLHAYDSYRRHSGLKTDDKNIELGIPSSYYTGHYGLDSTVPEVIVGYEDISKFVVSFLISCTPTIPGVPTLSAQSFAAMQSVQPASDRFFNMSIEDKTENSTVEVNFENVPYPENSIATVNVSDGISNYSMEMDINGDNTTDLVIAPTSISVTPAQPNNNLTIMAYTGTGRIGLYTSSGNFTSASNFNESSIKLQKPPFSFPYGLVAFNISGLSIGQAVEVTITLPQNLSSNSLYWTYGRTIDNTTAHYYPILIGSNDGDNTLTIRLEDGGIGDDDLRANGQILDAGGPGVVIVGDVSGGGWIRTSLNNKASFGFVAHYTNSSTTPSGNMEFKDTSAGLKVNGNVTLLSVDTATNTSIFTGIAKINGVNGYSYLVTIVDNGEPSKKDTFAIEIPAMSYKTSGTLMGGNIQIHKNK